MSYNKNNIVNTDRGRVIMYIDMNNYFASCEQQLNPRLRGRPIGVCPYVNDNAVIIAPSREAKKAGVTTGMRFDKAKQLCPNIEMVACRPVKYRKFHVEIMNILRSYCEDVIPKSIDEAVMNLTSYKYLYKDVHALAKEIKTLISGQVGEYITCSIGISQNVFLAKLATEIEKPDGLIEITPENLENYLLRMKLTDLPGIASASQKRLNLAGIYRPVDMLNASESLLRKAFGGVVGNYWYHRLHFTEVDLYTAEYRRMSAMRTLSAQTRSSKAALMGMLVSLCTKLEQRMVKSDIFCTEISFYADYYDNTSWKTTIKIQEPLQDGIDMLHYIQQRIRVHEAQSASVNIFTSKMRSMGVLVGDFISASHLQYSLFDNKIQKDLLRKTVYNIKDKYGKDIVRKAAETVEGTHLKDAIGFGSVKDLYDNASPGIFEKGFNKYLLE